MSEAEYAWGHEFTPGGRHQANTWQGEFPRQNLGTDGYDRTSPVTAFPPNGHGVHDMIGNVWEWTSDWYSQKHDADAPKACCIPQNPRGGSEDASFDPRQPQIRGIMAQTPQAKCTVRPHFSGMPRADIKTKQAVYTLSQLRAELAGKS